MSIESTQYLSKLSHDEIKTVYKQWPNPLMPLGFMIGGLLAMMYGLHTFNQDKTNVGVLLGAVGIFVTLTIGSSIFNLVKVAKARKTLNMLIEKYSLPQKKLLKEFKQNLKHMKTL